MQRLKMMVMSVLAVVLDNRMGEGNGAPPNLSIGRVLLMATFSMAAYTWMWKDKDIHSGMLTFLMTIAGYVLGDKVVGAYKTYKTSRLPKQLPRAMTDKPATNKLPPEPDGPPGKDL